MDDPQRDIDRIERRTRRYWFDDGLVEIVTGSGFLLVALTLVLVQAGGGRLGWLANLAFIVAVFIAAFGGRRAVRVAKDRYVHPRTGYVSFQCRRAPRWLNALLGFVIAAVLTIALSHAPAIRDWIPALMGATLAAGFLVLGRSEGTLRFPLAGTSCALVGVGLAMLRLSEDLAAGLLFAWTGIVLLGGGTVAFLLYLRGAPPAGDPRLASGAREDA